MNDREISSDKLSSKVNALIIIDIQEKIIRPIFNKDSIIKNIKKLINAYQILEENIYISEQNPLKLGVTIPELSPVAEYRKFEKMEFSLAKLEDFLKELKDKKITNLIVCGIETHICIQQTVLDFLNDFCLHLENLKDVSFLCNLDLVFVIYFFQKNGNILILISWYIFTYKFRGDR